MDSKTETVSAYDLIKGKKYVIYGSEYLYDGFSTFWNLRMYDENGKLHIFQPDKTEIHNSQSPATIK